MSQWGSKALADKGILAIDILKHYYGQDVFLMQAEKVSGIPASFDGKNLQVGSNNESVRMMQEQLNVISKNYPAIKKVKEDGIFEENTRIAVETFQQAFNLPATGIVDFATWYKISQVYVAVTKMAEIV